MPNRLLKTALAHESTKNFLSKANDTEGEVSAYLTHHILILLSAEIQQELYKIAEERSKKIDDPNIRNFISTSTKRLVRSVGKDDVANFAAYFGAPAKEKFNNLLDERTKMIYAGALTKRHEIAHKGSCNATFSELSEIISCSEKFLDALEASINQPTAT